MRAEKTRWSRIRMRYPLNEAGLCTTIGCFNKKGVVILRVYDEEGKEFFYGCKCRGCMEEWLEAFKMSVFDIEDAFAF